MKMNITRILTVGLALTGTLTLGPQVHPVQAAIRADDPVERATTSTLGPITLPDGAFRSTNAPDLEKFESALGTVAKTNHGRIGKIEVLAWTDKEAMKQLPERLKEADYDYTAAKTFEAEGAKVTPVTAISRAKEESRANLVGMWVEKDGIILLAWGQFTSDSPDGPAKTEREQSVESDQEVKAPAPRANAAGSRIPADVIGEWSWTTISSVNYRDTTTNQLMEPSGMSAKFTFTRDGRYKKFFYVRQRTYSLVTESTTTEEGTVVFNADGTFLIKPTRGHYAGHTGTRPIDRDMTESERKPTTWYWEWRSADGKRQLYIGPSKEALKLFKRA